ncbi:MAG: histidine kinase, partial [Hymenobacter sp.]|nr:histidine kinase [Hymenobacter sp.]
MAQTKNSGFARFLRALDERWWLRHGLFWLVDLAWVTWFLVFQLRIATNWQAALHTALLLPPLRLVLTYTLLYGVLPRLWLDTGRGRFLGLLAAWFWLGLALNFAYRYWVLIPSHEGVASTFQDFNIVFATGSQMPLLLTAGLAACLRLYRQWRQKDLDNVRLTQENARAELQLLRAQVHPHFLFNTLNNLYALTLRQSDQAPVVVERLTGLLQFVVKQGTAPLVSLPDEVALLRNYLALERLRYGERLTLEFEAGDMPATGRIAPLLLLPLVENAFKHGSAEQLGQARIRIALAVRGNTFSCLIENTKNADAPAPPKHAGIGLRNVRQRLHLLYPQRHQLTVEAHDHTFTVRLTLALPEAPAPGARRAAP